MTTSESMGARFAGRLPTLVAPQTGPKVQHVRDYYGWHNVAAEPRPAPTPPFALRLRPWPLGDRRAERGAVGGVRHHEVREAII
jgi:hypothetical protein